MKAKFKLAIFDMDGVLVDSEVHWAESGPEIWGQLGVKYTKAIEKDILGLNVADSVKIVKAKHGYKVSTQKAKNVYKSFRKIVYTEKSNLLPGVLKLLEALKKNGMNIALASGASFESIGRVMDKHKLHYYFELKFSTTDMKLLGKPDPAIYETVIKKFRLSPKQTVVFEDSLPGVHAGKASGAKVIAVPNERPSHGDFSSADLIVKSLADKKVYKFLGIK